MPKRKPRPGLNKQIREVRKVAGMTQTELADAISVSQRFVSGLESGQKTPSIHRLIAICKATGHTFPIDGDTVVFTE